MHLIRSIAVFCGSKPGNNPIYLQHASSLGKLLAEKNITIIYGGGNKGLMAAVANSAMDASGKVIGIMPEMLAQTEHRHDGITELLIVDSMHTRKKLLYEKCDAAIILPGGFGTLDEFFEMLTWNQLNIHNKKIFFLNSAGFYDHLKAHIHLMQEEDMLYGHPEDRMVTLSTPEELFNHLEVLP